MTLQNDTSYTNSHDVQESAQLSQNTTIWIVSTEGEQKHVLACEYECYIAGAIGDVTNRCVTLLEQNNTYPVDMDELKVIEGTASKIETVYELPASPMTSTQAKEQTTGAEHFTARTLEQSSQQEPTDAVPEGLPEPVQEAVEPSRNETMALAPAADPDEARRFLNLLDPTAKTHTFQTYDDNKTRRDENKKTLGRDPLAKVFHGTFDQCAGKLVALNKHGAAVCVMVNAGDGQGRKAKNVVRVRAVVADLDLVPLSAVSATQRIPNIIVRSSPGKHQVYWLCTGLPLDQFTGVQLSIVARTGADPNDADLPRVLRLPGFLHQKGQPFRVRILHPKPEASKHAPYSAEEILSTFPLVQKRPSPKKSTTGVTGKAIPLGLNTGQVTDETIDDLRSALAVLPSDDRALWVAVGEALCGLGDVGLTLWLEWSAKSQKFHFDKEMHPIDGRSIAEREWATFTGDRTSYAAVFAKAQAVGWKNPRMEVKSSVLAAIANPGNDNLQADEFSFASAIGTFTVNDRGVYHAPLRQDDDDEQHPRWIASSLRVIAKTRDEKSGEWGRLLEWRDDDGTLHRWAMPMELLQGDGSALRSELARRGLSIATGKSSRDMLAAYIQVFPLSPRARCVERLGWHQNVYVTPTEAIGQSDEMVVFQNAHAIEPAFAVAGSVDDWRNNVAAVSQGNSRLVFTISVAFAGPLAEIAGEDSGGFHLRGSSSGGKTTSLKVAASVWGNPNVYPRLWRATTNGLEGLAALHNDGLLILDELSQVDPRDVGEAAYMLANGQGKARATRTGTARQAQRWRLLFLSAGEESLAALMSRAGRYTTAGQEIRLAEISSDAGAELGIFENLHGKPSAAAFADSIKIAAQHNYGAVGIEFLRRIVASRTALATRLAKEIKQFCDEVSPPHSAGQVLRVAHRFGLVAVAGELATQYGLTGWPQGESTSAAKKCFAAWLESFGGIGNLEERKILSQVRAFFEAHGASRFEGIGANDNLILGSDQRIPNRAGFFRIENSVRKWYVLREIYKREICHGLDERAATKVLRFKGWIEKDSDGKSTQPTRLPGLGTVRCYVFGSRMWDDNCASGAYT
jgi:uncharacterized protein (DUF927 family)